MTQKAAIGVLIGLAAGVIFVKTVVAQGLIMGAVDVNWDNMHREMTSMRQDIIVLQIVIVHEADSQIVGVAGVDDGLDSVDGTANVADRIDIHRVIDLS